MASRGFLSPRRSNPTRTAASTYLSTSKSAPETILETATPAPTRRTTKSASQPTHSNKKGKAATGPRAKSSAVNKDGSSHKFSDSPNHSLNHFPSSVQITDQLHQTSIQDVKDDVANSVHHSKSLHKSVSSDSNDQYNSESNAPTILFKIYEEIASHRQGKSSIKTYFKNLKALWNEPAATYSDSPQSSSNPIVEQTEFMEREKLMQFLLGLNGSYSSLSSQILLVRPSPTVHQAFSIISGEEATRKLKISKKN